MKLHSIIKLLYIAVKYDFYRMQSMIAGDIAVMLGNAKPLFALYARGIKQRNHDDSVQAYHDSRQEATAQPDPVLETMA